MLDNRMTRDYNKRKALIGKSIAFQRRTERRQTLRSRRRVRVKNTREPRAQRVYRQ